MKQTLQTIVGILFLSLIANARLINVFITPHLESKAQKIQIVEEIGKLALKGIDPGDTLNLYCGETMSPIARLSVPSHKAYQNNWEERLKSMLGEYKKFKSWVVRPPVIEGKPLSLDIPRIFHFAAANAKAEEVDGAILLIGSPIFTKASEIASSMEDGYYPSDGNLSATSRESIYGLRDAVGRLKDIEIHWACLEMPYRDADHELVVERWWSLYSSRQGAVLRSCEESLSNVTSYLTDRNSTRVVSDDMPNSDARVGMHQVQARTLLPVGENQDSALHFLQTDNVESRPLSATLVKGCRIGIRWQGKHDLDLFVRPTSSAKELYFGHNRSEKGRHIKDFISEPSGVDTYEVVELEGAVDLSELQISVNTYRGQKSVEEIVGSVRMEINGRVYSKPFRLAASEGNKGTDKAGNRSSSIFWAVVDPLELTGGESR